jgi:hypothetical protein
MRVIDRLSWDDDDRIVAASDDVPVPIIVWVCDEGQQRLASLHDVRHLVPPPLPPGWYEPLVGLHARDRFPMLSHVDRYGHTVFNRIQMSTLVEELLAIELTSMAWRSALPARYAF